MLHITNKLVVPTNYTEEEDKQSCFISKSQEKKNSLFMKCDEGQATGKHHNEKTKVDQTLDQSNCRPRVAQRNFLKSNSAGTTLES
jgi:hypothetical protein